MGCGEVTLGDTAHPSRLAAPLGPQTCESSRSLWFCGGGARVVLPIPDFSGKNPLTCRDQTGQGQGDAVPQSRAGHTTGSARSLQTLLPLPRDPRHGAQSTHRPPPALCQPIFHTRHARSFGFPQCLEGPGSRRVSHSPLPKSRVGLHDSAQRNAATTGAGGGFKGMELSWVGQMGETAGNTGCRTMVGPSEMSPWWRTSCPHGHPSLL